MRALLVLFGVLFALLGAVDAPAGAEPVAPEEPCCCDEGADDHDAHCCSFDGGRCCTSGSVLPLGPAVHVVGITPAPDPTAPASAELHAPARALGPPPLPPPIA